MIKSPEAHRPSEVAPGIHRLVMPGPGMELDHVNVYAVLDSAGVFLVDSGFDHGSARDLLRSALATLGAAPEDIHSVFLTHLHPDHYGLSRWLANSFGTEILAHGDAARGRHADEWDVSSASLAAWMHTNGFPSHAERPGEDNDSWSVHHPPDQLLSGGTILTRGAYRLEVVATPGHSPGLACLFDAASGILFSADHVLPRISPHVGRFHPGNDDPLGDYLDSLRRVAALGVGLVLPGHGDPFEAFSTRVTELLEHHRERSEELEVAIAGALLTGYEAAARVSWRGSPNGWQSLREESRFMAVTETLAHLRRMELEGSAVITLGDDGLTRFSRRRS
ncbi:MAG: MBL fold metallo-hydrolase [Candidatus Dormibacteria bacterium]